MENPQERPARRVSLGLCGLLLGIAALLLLFFIILRIEPEGRARAGLRDVAEGDQTTGGGASERTVRSAGQVDPLAPSAFRGLIAGRLLDARTRAPLSGREVVALDEHPGLDGVWQRVAAFGIRDLAAEGARGEVHGACKSGPDGSFEIEGLSRKRYFLAIRDPYLYAQPVISVRLDSARPQVRDVVLTASTGGRIRGRVLDLDQLPVAGVRVSAHLGFANFLGHVKDGSYRWCDTISDEDGYFEISGYPSARGIVLTGSHPDYVLSHCENVVVHENSDAAPILYMKRGGTLSGRVLGAEGEPLMGAEVSILVTRLDDLIFAGEFARGHVARTDEQGFFALRHVPAGFIEVNVEHPGYLRSVRRGVRIPEEGKLGGLVFQLASGQSLAGIVRDPEGRPVAGASVRYRGFDFDSFTITRAGEMLRGRTSETDELGRFALEDLPRKSSYRLEARAKGYGRGVAANLKAGAEDVEIILTRPAAIRGRVVDAASGQPVSAFRVSVSGRANRRRRGLFGSRDALPGRGSGGDPVAFGPGSAQRRGRGRQFESEDGRFLYEGVEPGERGVSIRAEGYCPTEVRKVTVEAGEPGEELLFELSAGGSVTGVVVSALDQSPVIGARVFLGEREQPLAALTSSLGIGRTPALETDTKGRFRAEHLRPGRLILAIIHPDFAKFRRTGVEVEEGEETDLGSVAIGLGATLYGRVSDPQGRPAQHATVLVGTPAGMDFGQAMPDEDGNYEIDKLIPGSYIVLATRADEDMNPLSLIGNLHFDSVKLVEGERKRLDLVDDSSQGCRVRGIVLENGQPVAGVMVMAMADGGSGPLGIRMKLAPSDQDGRFEFPALPPGRYFLQIRRGPGRGGTRLELEVPTAEETFVTVVIPSGRVAGRVLDAQTSAAIEGVRVRLAAVKSEAGEEGGLLGRLFDARVAAARTDSEGRFEFEHVAPGAYKVIGRLRQSQASDLGYGEGESDVLVVTEGGELETQILMEPAGGLQGRVVDARGEPVRGASIFLDRDGKRMEISDIVSKRDGTFSAKGLRTGTYTLAIEAKEFLPLSLPGQQVIAGEITRVDAQLLRGARLEALVLDAGGSPVSGARVELRDGQGRRIRRRFNLRALLRTRMLTTAEGRIDLGTHPPGAYQVVAKRGRRVSEAVAVTLADGGQETVEIRLR